MNYPHFEAFEFLARTHTVVPVICEIPADMETPISLFRKLEGRTNRFLLESVEGGEKWARYSFLGYNPKAIFSSKNGTGTLAWRDGAQTQADGNPLEVLRTLLAPYKSPVLEGAPRLTGGVVGFFGYDVVRFFEKIPETAVDELNLPDCRMMLVDELVAFDHLKQTMNIIVNAEIGKDARQAYQAAQVRIEAIRQELRNAIPPVPAAAAEKRYVREASASCDKEGYMAMVRKAREYIYNGDIFQVVPSRRVALETNIPPFTAYRALRSVNPSPYMYYLDFEDFQVAGASPEMLTRVDGHTVETCPIAGTRRRGSNREEDEALAAELLADEKEIAEHTMLVDLGRNDIGRVSRFGTVKVSRFMGVDRYSHVMHIVSTVRGELRDEYDALDALRSIFPAGTLSGAPKVRAMEIIEELEGVRRGLYGGATGYVGFDGNMDTCITIRTAVFKDGKAYIQAGAGVVYDSDPESEFHETENKARAMIRALERAGDFE